MNHFVRRAWLCIAAWAVCFLPDLARGQQADSVIARIGALVVAGERAEARRLADSLLGVLSEGSATYAEALYWRGFASSSAADAARDYLRVVVEYPTSPRAPAALLALAQLDYARGDRVSARRRYDRLLQEYPRGPHVARAAYWSGRLALELGDRGGCASLAAARRAAAADDVELANQIEYYLAQCAVQSVPSAASDSVSGGGASAVPRAEFSVQVAAFNTRREAENLVNRLKRTGFEARVVGIRAPFRVRVGRFPTRAAAVDMLAKLRKARFDGMVVEAEPR
ncbi:MAG TPA: SPOR domain-containing protein [Gemmatimonadaceae bacterium]|nr:SPOR domain-containing protein [Gemmatimonadaceae bacterium]